MPTKINYLRGIDLDKLSIACIAWTMAEVESKVGWEDCRFNMDKFLSALNFVPEINFFSKLVLSGLIKPDGTYDEDWITQQYLKKELENERRSKSSKRNSRAREETEGY